MSVGLNKKSEKAALRPLLLQKFGWISLQNRTLSRSLRRNVLKSDYFNTLLSTIVPVAPGMSLASANLFTFFHLSSCMCDGFTSVLQTAKLASYNERSQHTKLWLKGDLQDCGNSSFWFAQGYENPSMMARLTWGCCYMGLLLVVHGAAVTWGCCQSVEKSEADLSGLLPLGNIAIK